MKKKKLRNKILYIKNIKYNLKPNREIPVEGLILPVSTTYDATDLLNKTDSLLTIACEIKYYLEKGNPVDILEFTIDNLHNFLSMANGDMIFKWAYEI